MPYNLTTGVFTNVSGASTATAGQTIASATWNSIHNDYGTALNQMGQLVTPYINGAQEYYYSSGTQTVNFAASAGDIGIFNIASVLPPTVTWYGVDLINISKAQGNLNSATVSLFTGAGATGTTVMGSTATTITTSVSNTNGNLQRMIPANSATQAYSAPTLYLHVTTSTATSSLANVAIIIRPIY